MYFRIDRLGKIWLNNCLRSPILEQFTIVNILKVPDTAGIFAAAVF